MSLAGDLFNFTLGGSISFELTSGYLSIHWTGPAILSWIIFALTLLLGVPGNGAVVCVMGFKMKRTVQTVCFLNLAVADLTHCLTLPFLLTAFLVPSWRRDLLLQNCVFFAIAFNMSASIFLLTLISITRCIAVTRPIWFRQRLCLAWVRAACFGTWALAFLMSLPHLLFHRIVSYLGDNTEVVLEVTWTVFAFGLPVVIIAACYLLIARELGGDRFAQSRKPFRLIVTVVAAFLVCWLPNNVCCLLQAFSQDVPWDWMDVTFGLASFNSALNPLFYVFVGRDFRQVFRSSLAASLRLAFAEQCSDLGRDSLDPAVSTETRV